MFGFVLLLIIGGIGFVLVRAGARPSMIVFLLIGMFVPLSIALAAWFLSSPPIWTLIAPRADAIVQVSDVVVPREGARANGGDVIDVRVRMESERSGRLLPLFGVEPPDGAFADRLAFQNALREAYPVGRTITVRVSRDVTYVDRQDWFLSAVFAFCLVFALLFTAIVLVIASAQSGTRKQTPPA